MSEQRRWWGTDEDALDAVPAALRSFAESYRCPDCNPDIRLIQWVDGGWSMDVLHDDACPLLAEMERA